MDLDQLFAPKILIVSGKGGVGKTTVAAALAVLAARSGRTTCLVEVDGAGSLSRLFDAPELGYEARELFPKVWGINVRAEDALAEYLNVQYHLKRVSKVFTSTHFVDYVTAAAPGLKDILTLGKIWYLEQGRRTTGMHAFDTIIVDAPAAGHMLTFLSAPLGLSDAVRVGPIRRQAEWLINMLRDPARVRVHLVALPEEMPVSETIETAAALETKLRIPRGVVFANAVYEALFDKEELAWLETATPDPTETVFKEGERVGISIDHDDASALLSYARFREARRAIQAGHLEQLRRKMSSEIVQLPLLFTPTLVLPDIETLADAVLEQVSAL